MSSFALIQIAAPVLAALAGGAAGWWLRGRPKAKTTKARELPQKKVAAQVLQNLQAAAETVRSCVEQHADCIRAIKSELDEASSTEPIIITKLADSIVESTGLVQHQCNDIQKTIHSKRQEIRDCLASSDRLLFTFASLDRQEQAYRQVLSSLEVLAAELNSEIKGHGQRLQQISGGLESSGDNTAEGVASAVAQILDATADVEQRVAKTEQRIAAQAEGVEMQAILTHADLLTSLPNRRALVAEMQKVAGHSGQTPKATLIFIDLDSFSLVNSEYGHQGGDMILRQAATEVKKLARGKDLVARFRGDTFALLLNQTTLHDALPIAEKVRKQLEDTHFTQGTNLLRVTASVGIAQLRPEELLAATTDRVEQALLAAQQAGGNVCYRHDGENCIPVSSAFQAKSGRAAGESLSLAAYWRDSATEAADAPRANPSQAVEAEAELSGRSLFAANLNRRLAEWKRGGASVSVAVLRVDQMDALVGRFGDQGRAFLRQVMGRLLEATTRDMDERCEFEDGLFAFLLPGTDESNALAVAERICAQVRQCKVRMGRDLWDLTASIGVAHCNVAARVMDIMLSAEAALHTAAEKGGDAVCIGQAIQEPASSAIV
jgi:diguanylate cyclase (GGDEF)-like protein